jgi:hypothetical protein
MMDSQDERWAGLFRGGVISAIIAKHVGYLTSADTRAQGLIILNSGLASIALTGIKNPSYALPATLCIVTAIVTIILCVLALYPKQLGARSSMNVFHYAHFKRMSEQEYLSEMKKALSDNSLLAEMVAKDLYHLGKKVLAPKYFFLRLAYAAFLIGQLVAVSFAIFA